MNKRHIETHVTIVPVNSFAEVNKEKRFPVLNQSGFVRTQTAGEQWILLVNDAWKKTKLPINETMRDYLSVMLHKYMTRHDLFETLANFNYLRHLLEGTRVDSAVMKEIADASLMYLTFVPGRSLSRRETRSLAYSTRLGESMYQQLAINAAEKDDCVSEAHKLMAEHFGTAIMVMRSFKFPVHEKITLPGALEIPPDSIAAKLAQQYLLYTQPSVGTA